MRRDDAPCLKCERRGRGSYHDSCHEYTRYKQEKEYASMKRHENAEASCVIHDNIRRLRTKKKKILIR